MSAVTFAKRARLAWCYCVETLISSGSDHLAGYCGYLLASSTRAVGNVEALKGLLRTGWQGCCFGELDAAEQLERVEIRGPYRGRWGDVLIA